ncbi:MAG: TIGR02147 family protein [Bdellovibrionaceae bacterium]|nr:TIGR02147 family protein [Pseudobdellovibrionaceae bacterium]
MDSYREILNKEFEKRNLANPKYTWGAFSKQIGLSPSQLHDILKGRHGISRHKAEAVALRLRLNEAKTALFCTLVESEHARSQKTREQAKRKLQQIKDKLLFKKMAPDRFALISEWYHFAILELLEHKNFQPKIEWIANQLKLTFDQATSALDRLERLGLLKRLGHVWKSTEDFSLVGNHVPSKAIRHYHQDILTKAKLALEQQSFNRREFQAATLSLSTKDLPEAKKMIEDFLRNFGQRFHQTSDKDAVYNLSLQLFSLSKEENP